ncbi:type I glyceraldehyde-3-phosphate dehydrogenase [Streptomyces griseocarneus]|uniref:type I glyceraldehyde-3-phosphate dehydrogenase n=1 Tax=Streptomyces griseocarneus TaxID=51201 RepID=UPI00167E2374|nr:type I glyceraldehyde-3-phosphate dehydrogenase [Streptomyces griseocarneus]MBZ6473145.1 type I glyceraldehyde-3-phosphate dehydrogenase [Streptomyces griseocarneus]GHG60096.1 glyceraldehyde-3-phosphate dehydrogenase [Streptomyces griseocarneus]
MTLRLAINGFGRIGRTVARAALRRSDVEIVAVNDLSEPALLAHLLKYDSVHGRLDGRVEVDGDHLVVDGRRIRVLSEKDPADLPWGELDVDVVVESTGVFTNAKDAQRHLDAGARRVLISAPATGEDLTVVMGVNSDAYDGSQRIISNASCTTNCAAMMAKVLNDSFGIQRGLMNTVHAYTSDQRIQDVPHKDYRRARAAAANIVPTSTGAARAIGLVLPELAGRLDGLSMRVPVIDGSVVDLTVELDRVVTAEEVNEAFRKAAEGDLADYLVYTEDPIVSSDIVSTPASCTFDAQLTMVSDRPGGGSVVKAIGWYDNEYGFSHRTLDLALMVGGRD